METKAAKTLGIIVGCFICCWFPFFTMYLVTAFCADCIPKLVFSVIFWLGYCNSAINPFIYAAFSRDFRGAFKKIICKVLCRYVKNFVLCTKFCFVYTLGHLALSVRSAVIHNYQNHNMLTHLLFSSLHKD